MAGLAKNSYNRMLNEKIVLAPLLAFAAPLPLLLIEWWLPYPFVIEELVKAGLVLMIISAPATKDRTKFLAVVLSGVLFTLSESIFYLFNYLCLHHCSLFLDRLWRTGGLHISSLLILFIFARYGKFWLIVGFLLAVILHAEFNMLFSP